MLINSPQRHELIPSLCVNKEVLKFIRQIKKITKSQPNVKLLELNLDRNHFTCHGLQMKLSGKELVSQNLAMITEQLYKNNQKHPICISWKDSLFKENNTVTQALNNNVEKPKSALSSKH